MKGAKKQSTLSAYQNALGDIALILREGAEEFHSKSEKDARSNILVRASVRLAKSSETIILLSEKGHAVEIRCINRSLAETVIDAAYLQRCDLTEVHKFRSADAPKRARTALRMSSLVIPEFRLSNAEQSEMRRVADRCLREGWTTKTLAQRAYTVDSVHKLRHLMALLAAVGYEANHPFAHNSFFALLKASDEVTSHSHNELQPSEEVVDAISNSIWCLFTFAIFVCEVYRLKTLDKVAAFNTRVEKLAMGA